MTLHSAQSIAARMPQATIPQLNNELMQRYATALGNTCTLQQQLSSSLHSKLAQISTDFQTSTQGVIYQTVGNMRASCAEAKFGTRRFSSASVLTESEHQQQVYLPRYVSMVGFLIAEPVDVRALASRMFDRVPATQSATQIQTQRAQITAGLKSGQLQRQALQSMTAHSGYALPRQCHVNEALIRYHTDQISALVIPKSAQQWAQSQAPTTPRWQQYEAARIAIQLAYASQSLGERPIVHFDGRRLVPCTLSANDWQARLQRVETLAQLPATARALNDPNSSEYHQLTGMRSAALQLDAIESRLDPDFLKHAGGQPTAMLVDVVSWLGGRRQEV